MHWKTSATKCRGMTRALPRANRGTVASAQDREIGTPNDDAAADRRETAALLDWTRAQLGWLRTMRYREVDAILVRSRFSLWYVKSAVGVVGVAVDRSRGETGIRLGPDEGVKPAYARVVSLPLVLGARGISTRDLGPHGGTSEGARRSLTVLVEALKCCAGHELEGHWEHFEDAVNLAHRSREEQIQRVRTAGPPVSDVVDELRTASESDERA
jgi:hypothetical protein